MGCGSSAVAEDPRCRPYDEDKDEDATETGRYARAGKKASGNRASYDPSNLEDVWLSVCQTIDVPQRTTKTKNEIVVKRSGWKTIRIFVSSTFKDFHQEREILVKEVFPDLRAWCEARRLHLVECDLRWGVPKDSTTEATLRTCLGEIDRCYADNVMPYFLNMTSQRIGWIPSERDVPLSLVEEYNWIFGLSMTEMEIMHGAYRKDNPNSLFMMRDDSFISTIPKAYQCIFCEENPLAQLKLKKLKEKIEERFADDRVIMYGCRFGSVDKKTEKVRLLIDDVFKTKIFEFFKERIRKQYPLEDRTTDVYQQGRESHEAFMKNRAELVLGRQDILDEISEYVSGGENDVPLLVIGGPGSGKSSIVAKIADLTEARAFQKQIPNGGKRGWRVFYHFVGAVPGSTELEPTLKRLLKEMEAVNEATMPTDMDSVCQLMCGALSNQYTTPTVIFIDAVNQFNEDPQSLSLRWVPRKISPNIRLILSMIQDTPQHKALVSRESKPRVLEVKPLDLMARMVIVRNILGRFNKVMDQDQMVMLLANESSANPLWLAIACEELRVFGDFHKITAKVASLKDGLLELLEDVLSRFEDENGGHLLVATLCLLEVSQNGLLESELLSILADEDNLMPATYVKEKGVKEKSEKQKKKTRNANLPAYKWATVFRALRPFLRPYGDIGEGRLDFYHRSLSKAVRRKYMQQKSDEAENEMTGKLKKWWHQKLVDYFEGSDNLTRRLEEYPHHLIAIKDKERMTTFLCEEFTLNELIHEDSSAQLLKFWREGGGGLTAMTGHYKDMMLNYASSTNVDQEMMCSKYFLISRALLEASSLNLAKEYAEIAVNYFEQSKTGGLQRLADAYSVLSRVEMEIAKFAYPNVCKELLTDLSVALALARKTYDIRITLSGPENEFKLAVLMIRLAGIFTLFVDGDGNEELSAPDAAKEARVLIDKGCKVFTKLNDNGKLANAIMCKGCLYRDEPSQELKYYKEALDLCQQAYGEYSILAAKLYTNIGIHHEDEDDFDTAFDYYYKTYQLRLVLFGPEHMKTQKILGYLMQPIYIPIAAQKNITLP